MPGSIRWLDHREAINCRGDLFDRAWTGAEHMAFGPGAYNRDMAEILLVSDDVAAAAFDRAVQTGIEEVAAGPVIEPGEPCVTCGKPSFRIIAGKKYCGDHGDEERPPIPEAVLKRIDASTALAPASDEESKRARAQAGREILVKQLDTDYEPEREARDRLFQQYGELRADVFGGKVRIGARWPGLASAGAVAADRTTAADAGPPPMEQREIRPLVVDDELRHGYPGDPHETRIELPSLPLPMTLVFSKADILRLRPPEDGASASIADKARRTRRGEYKPFLKTYMARNAAALTSLDDREIASRFRTQHPQLQLPRNTRDIAKQVAAIRKELAKLPIAAPNERQ